MTVIVLTLAGTGIAGSASVGTAGVDELGAVERGLSTSGPTRSEHCPDVRHGLAFYRGRYAEHRAKMGAAFTAVRRPRNCADAHYLSRLWKQRAQQARFEARRWLSSIGVVVRRLEGGMRGSPMAGTGVILEREGRRHHVSPYFMVAVAATESSLGRAACSNDRHNVWGLASCVDSWPVPRFGSWQEAISYYARFLSNRWRGHSSPFSFRGYAACSDCWARKVSYWMSALFGVPATTRYP